MSSKGKTISAARVKNLANVPLISISPERGKKTSSTVAMRISCENARKLMRNLAVLCCEDTVKSQDKREFSGDLALTAHYGKKKSRVGVLRWDDYTKTS